MNAPRTRTDDRLDAWARATARPIPVFAPVPKRRPWARVAALVAVGAAILGGLIVGGFVAGNPPQVTTREPKNVAVAAAQAIAVAPGVQYSLSIVATYPEGISGVDSDGAIDFERRRFSGSAHKSAGAETMLFFGGPNSGSLIIADGLFVRTETGPWERQADQATPFDPLMDRAAVSKAVASTFTASEVDPAIKVAPCGSATCQVVRVTVRPFILSRLARAILGNNVSALPSDLVPTAVDLYVDGSGFPVMLETRLTAGTTVTAVTLRLTRLDPPPAIAPPIP